MASVKVSVPKPTNDIGFWIAQILWLVITIGVNWSMITWINKLDEIKCECSKDWKRPGLQYWAYFAIAFGVLSFILNIYFYLNYGTLFKSKYLAGIVGLFSFINMIASILYIYNLKQIDCKCSEDSRREIIYIYNWIRAIFMMLSVIIFIYFIVIFTRKLLK